MDGLRASLGEEFTTIYVFNLRGNQRTSGEISRMEGGKIFGSGSRAGIAITILVKNPAKKGACEIFYHDIGDYKSREEKLAIIKSFQSINGLHREKKWKLIQPNDSHDWINQRDPAFETFVSLGDKKDDNAKTVFENYSQGVLTSRDKWCYNFSKTAVAANMERMIKFYNEELARFKKVSAGKTKAEAGELVEKFIDSDAKKISWSGNLKDDLARATEHQFKKSQVVMGIYRPFCKQALYHDRDFNERVYQLPRIFPKPGLENLGIAVDSRGSTKEFSVLITPILPDYEMISKGQCFPLYLYEKDDGKPDETDDDDGAAKQGEFKTVEKAGELIDGYRRRDAITDAILADFRASYEKKITKEDIFYYIYGVLHSPEYRTRFASDLKKMLPRIPFTSKTADFWKFSQAGRDLAEWHLNYETVKPYPVQEHTDALGLDPAKDFLVNPKMIFGRANKQVDKTTIIYNSHISISGIPLEAYDYVVNGKPAIEWIMERYQITVDKDSGIRNDPNDWAREHGDPKYILNLLKRVITVSLETMKIVNALPPLNESKKGATK